MSELIPWVQLTPPQAMWAEADESVEAVRQRLVELGGRSQYHAPILIRLPDGRIAPTSAAMLRKMAQEQGPQFLNRRLEEVLDELCPAPWAVETRSADHHEARIAASERRLPVLVVQQGEKVGLMPPPGHRAVQPDYSAGTFDLFDEPLTEGDLDQHHHVVATLDTSVAQVAKDLQSLADPRGAQIILRAADGSFRAMSARSLNQEVESLGARAWGLPLRQFESRLQPVSSYALGSIGREQARLLADRERLLILTEGGQVKGLLYSGVVFRSGEGAKGLISEGAARGMVESYSLFDAPRAMLDGYPAEVRPEKAPRYVNLWFEEQDASPRPLDRAKPLILGHIYYLALNVGVLRPALSIIDWEQTTGGPQAIVEPQEKEAFLYVSVFSGDLDIPEPTQPLRLPREGDTETARIPVEPLRRSRSGDPARLEVCLYYRAYLVQTFEVRVEVVEPGEQGRAARPQVATLTHARTASFPEMGSLPPRELSLTIHRDGPDRYRFTFLVDPDPEDEVAARKAIEMSCPVRLTREELTHLITKARRQLYNVVQTFDLIQERDVRTNRKAMRALAQVGRQLYLKLFESELAQALGRWMEETLPDGSTIQVVDLAGDFIFPWSLVYTAAPWADDKPIDETRFWGWRYKLVLLTSGLLDTYRQARTEITTDEPLRASVGVYERLKGIDKQKEFFESLGERTGQRLHSEILNNRRTMSRALTAGDQDLYYFFCHGYTERIATDIQLDADLVRTFAQVTADAAGERSESIREHLDDLFDVSDSWMRLTRGKLPLTMLKETVPAPFARHPVVFLNMCESAQVLPSLSDGFVPFFLRRGARAVVGTECSMNTVFADDFSRAFLTRFLQGEAVGDILLALRRHYLEQQNPLALAYTLYCDADLRLGEPLLPT